MSDAVIKPIRLAAHAQSYLLRRGFTVSDVEDAIRTSPWLPTRQNRMEAAKDFPYNGDWNGSFYATRRVRPIFVETPDEIVVVTVYTYYF